MFFLGGFALAFMGAVSVPATGGVAVSAEKPVPIFRVAGSSKPSHKSLPGSVLASIGRSVIVDVIDLEKFPMSLTAADARTAISLDDFQSPSAPFGRDDFSDLRFVFAVVPATHVRGRAEPLFPMSHNVRKLAATENTAGDVLASRHHGEGVKIPALPRSTKATAIRTDLSRLIVENVRKVFEASGATISVSFPSFHSRSMSVSLTRVNVKRRLNCQL